LTVLPIRILIADDEPLARDGVRIRLEKEDDCLVVAECADGKSALAAIEKESPDLVFLDVQMPHRDGLEVIARLPETSRPVVILVTAFEEHALPAFDLEVLDYLLKPIADDRFARALERARRVLTERRAGDVEQRVREALGAETKVESLHIGIKTGTRTELLPVLDVDWVEASGNYVHVHAAGRIHVLRRTLGEFGEGLPKQFARIHRSSIVNLDRVVGFDSLDRGDSEVVLSTGKRLRVSRHYHDVIVMLAKKSL
jgi:two-component system LytT family response regulator